MTEKERKQKRWYMVNVVANVAINVLVEATDANDATKHAPRHKQIQKLLPDNVYVLKTGVDCFALPMKPHTGEFVCAEYRFGMKLVSEDRFQGWMTSLKLQKVIPAD